MYLQKNFNYLKETRGFTYRDISNPTGINMNTINVIANGDNDAINISIKTVVKLANFFSISIDELVLIDLEKDKKYQSLVQRGDEKNDKR